MNMKKTLTRRNVLRGAGVASPRCRGSSRCRIRGPAPGEPPPRRRFVAVYFPLGTPDFWTPSVAGKGAGVWKLSPLPRAARARQEPGDRARPRRSDGLCPERHPAQQRTAHGVISHGRQGADHFSGAPSVGRNGISIDQRIAGSLPAGTTPLPSLQLGLSTHDSYCDSTPCAYSRSISWAAADQPLYKLINPQAVFDRIVTGSSVPTLGGHGAAQGPQERARFRHRERERLEGRLGRTDR